MIYGIYVFKCLSSASFQIVPLCPFLRILIFFSLQVVDRIHLQQIVIVPWVVKVFHLYVLLVSESFHLFKTSFYVEFLHDEWREFSLPATFGADLEMSFVAGSFSHHLQSGWRGFLVFPWAHGRCFKYFPQTMQPFKAPHFSSLICHLSWARHCCLCPFEPIPPLPWGPISDSVSLQSPSPTHLSGSEIPLSLWHFPYLTFLLLNLDRLFQFSGYLLFRMYTSLEQESIHPFTTVSQILFLSIYFLPEAVVP